LYDEHLTANNLSFLRAIEHFEDISEIGKDLKLVHAGVLTRCGGHVKGLYMNMLYILKLELT